MLNKEKYVKEIFDIVCETGSNPAIINNAPIKCDDAQCSECKLYYCDSCARGFAEWANSEYKEREIDWSKVPVDTCILITDSYGYTLKRHFAKYDNKKIYAYPDGRTSWSFNQDSDQFVDRLIVWDEKNVQIKEGVDCSEWYKD